MLRFIQLVGFIFRHVVVLIRFVFVQRQFKQRIVIEFIRFVVGFVILVWKQFFRQFLGLIKQRFVER